MIITGLIGLHVESRRRDNRSRRPDRIEFPGGKGKNGFGLEEEAKSRRDED